jgi:hypothetical protein
MAPPPPKIAKRMRGLHALIGSLNAAEAASARAKLLKLLAEHSLSWNDLPEVIAAADADDCMRARAKASSGSGAPNASDMAPVVNVFDLVLYLIERYISATASERVAATLWVLHTHVFDRYMVTPRLALLSPIEGCGKTTFLILLEALARKPWRSDDVSPASIYYQVGRDPQTSFLIDEGDNLGLLQNQFLRRVFNSGHRRGGNVSRFIDGRPRKIPTFAPLALAAIGMELPRPLLHRSILVDMQRPPPDAVFEQLDETDPALPAARDQIEKWARTCVLSRHPATPTELRNREADNWRVLLAIADSLGHGEAARAAAIALTSGRSDEPVGVTLLKDIRDVFDAEGVDRIASVNLVAALLALSEGRWNEYRGLKDDRPARKLNQNSLAEALRPFGIYPRPLWPRGPREPETKPARGYLRIQFEAAWAAYCTSASPQPQKVISLTKGTQR